MGMLTARERQQLAELRRGAQKAPSPAEEFILRMKQGARDTHAERIERGIAFLLITLVLAGIVLTWLRWPTVSDILTKLFWLPRTF